MSIFRTYAAAILPAAIIFLGSLQAAIADGTITEIEGGQLIAVFAGVGITYFVPLFGGVWRGLFKTGFAALAAVATLVVPLMFGFSWSALVIFALAVLGAIATEIGVQVRTSVPVA